MMYDRKGGHIQGGTYISQTGKSVISKHFSQRGKEEGQCSWEVGIRGGCVSYIWRDPVGTVPLNSPFI